MKKRTSILIAFQYALLVIALEAPGAMGGTAEIVRVALDCQVLDGVLIVTATTPKRGASFIDRWSIVPWLALTTGTLLDESDPDEMRHVSTARVESVLAADTTYTVSYSIVMRARGDIWVGSARTAVTVGVRGVSSPLSFS